jgi:cell division protein FtsA
MQSGAVTDIEGVIQNSALAIKRAEEMAGVRVNQAVIGIAGELVKGATTTIHYERPDPKSRIDTNELHSIIKKVQWQAFEQVRSQLAWETGYSEIDVRLVNAAIVDVKIDGYKVTNPLGFQGKEVTVGVFNAFAPLVHLGALQTIAQDLDLDLLTIAAEPYAVARSVSAAESQEFSGIFIDIGGGTTDIAVVRGGGLEGTRMFALGGRTFTKRLAATEGLSFNDAEELKLAYSSGLLKSEQAKRVKEALQADCEVWLSGVELALSEFKDVDLLPSRILLCGGGSALPEIREALSATGWMRKLPFARAPKISFIEPRDVANIVDETSLLLGSGDITPMGLANVALSLSGEEPVMSNALRKVVKAMQV